MKQEGITRMPAQRQKHQTATHEARRHCADASKNLKTPPSATHTTKLKRELNDSDPSDDQLPRAYTSQAQQTA
jgi:hypothetical protein